MPRAIDLTGERFGRLTVISLGTPRIKPNGKPVRFWRCKCDCGNTHEGNSYDMKAGKTVSCGCFNRERAIAAGRGFRRMPEHYVWNGMRARCNNPKEIAYRNYGGRGILVCERWHAFENFLSDMGRRPSSKHTIDRIDNDGNYCPENCRWATREVQNSNKRNSVHLQIDGKKYSAEELAKISGIHPKTIRRRFRAGWPDQIAAFSPPNFGKSLTMRLETGSSSSNGHH